MPRKLPWIVKAETNAKDQDGKSAISITTAHDDAKTPITKRAKDEQHDDADTGDAGPSSKRNRNTTLYMEEPPKEEFMIEGYHADDGWRMVEDEFFMTARLFTAHLHAAEYRRLKKIAQENGRDRFFKPAEDIVVNASLNALRRDGRSKGKQRATSPDESAGQQGEDPFMKDTTLAAMMGGDRVQSSSQHLITRQPAAELPQEKPLDDAPRGWVGMGAHALPSGNDDMDLDDMPDTQDAVERRNHALHDVSKERHTSSDMWIGPGRSGPAVPKPPRPSMSTSNHQPNISHATRGSKVSTTPSDMWIGSAERERNGQSRGSAIPSVSNTAAVQQPSPSTVTSTSPDFVDFQRKALNPRVLARLEKRKQQQKSLNLETTGEDESKTEPEVIIPTFAY